MVIIIRYDEIGLKSKPVRARMEKALIQHLKRVLGDVRITKEYGRIFVHSDSRDDTEKAAKVFGVASTSLVVQVDSELENLIGKILEYARTRISSDESFALRVRRNGNHSYSSIEVARIAGAEVVRETNAKVNLTNPDVEIHVEIREDKAYIFDEIISGAGGLPYSTQGKAISLVSGGIDSPVSTYMAMRRGIKPICVFMNPSPLVDKRTEDRALETIKVLSGLVGEDLKTYFVPYGEVLIELIKVKDSALGCVLCKRMMYRTAEIIAEKERAKAIVTGESLGQVASQTLDNLATISKAISIPVLRPLIGMDKNEIIKIARKIGTYEISIMPANCCLGPPLKPSTSATPERAEKAENEIEVERLAEEMAEKARVFYA
ncbi:MAG TPA: tRNA 4-thiouridine(8) synthase ThiI [Euryarchaeota archaeon]|nr:tRNA 4-thiouridine(8) synthase ThiI [Euryarchaeota archaeon]